MALTAMVFRQLTATLRKSKTSLRSLGLYFIYYLTTLVGGRVFRALNFTALFVRNGIQCYYFRQELLSLLRPVPLICNLYAFFQRDGSSFVTVSWDRFSCGNRNIRTDNFFSQENWIYVTLLIRRNAEGMSSLRIFGEMLRKQYMTQALHLSS